MATLDADSLFTNIPLNEIIYICIDNLCSGNENSLTPGNMIFIICLRPFKINYLFIIICPHCNFYHFNWLFVIKWKNIIFFFFSLDFFEKESKFISSTFQRNHLKEKFTYLHITTSQYHNFFIYVFYLSVHYFKFVFSLISITHTH